MKRTKYNLGIRIAAAILIMAMIVPVNVLAAQQETVQPLSSYYLSSYTAGISRSGGGKIQVYADVVAKRVMDEIGALEMVVYESVDNITWTQVRTYSHTDHSYMLATDDIQYCSYVDYYGIAGRYYKAYVTIWAGRDGGGDTRYIWTTPSVRAY